MAMFRPGRSPFVLRDIERSRSGQMSFSVAAVVLLLVAGAGAAMISGMESANQQSGAVTAFTGEMVRVANSEVESIRRQAYSAALSVIESDPQANETAIAAKFASAWNASLASSYPKISSSFKLRVERSDVALQFLRLGSDQLSIWGEEGPTGGTAFSNVSVPAYFTLAGGVILNVSCAIGSISSEAVVDQGLYLPFPLLQNRLAAFSAQFAGGSNHFENVVRYELSLLLELRALSSGSALPRTDLELLDRVDVARAVGLAALIEQARMLRSLDRPSVEAVADLFPPEGGGADFIWNTLSGEGTVDPADLFLRMCCESEIDVRSVIAQSVYAAADAMGLKWLDYFQVIDLLKVLEGTAQTVELTVRGALDWVFGTDSEGESIRNWMRERFEAAGIQEDEYRWFGRDSPDLSIHLPGNSIVVKNSNGEEVRLDLGGTESIEFPTINVLDSPDWRTFYVDYKTRTFETGQMLQDFVKAISAGVASSLDVGVVTLSLDPSDGKPFIEELADTLQDSIAKCEPVVRSSLLSSPVQGIRDHMADALLAFVQGCWPDILDREASVRSALAALARSVVLEGVGTDPGFDRYSIDDAVSQVYQSMTSDSSWGVVDAVREAFEQKVNSYLDLFREAFTNVSVGGEQLKLAKVVQSLAGGSISGIPGLASVVERVATRMVTDIRQSDKLRGDQVVVKLHGLGSFSLLLEKGLSVRECLCSSLDPSFIRGGSTGAVIVYPHEYPTSAEDYPNHHVTDLGNLTMMPFQSQFGVTVSGGLKVTVTCQGELSNRSCRSLPSIGVFVPYQTSFNLVTSTGGPIDPVEYRPTMTLVKQIEQVFQAIWDGIVGALEWIWNGLCSVFSFLGSVLSSAISYAIKAVEAVSELLTQMVQALSDLVKGALGGFIQWLGETISASAGTVSISFSLFGISFVIETDANDIPYGKSRDYIRIIGTLDIGGSVLSIGVRLAQIYKKGADVLVNGSLVGEGWALKGSLDPLMFVSDHFFQLTGEFADWVLELVMPKIVQYDRLSLVLSDVPGIGAFLSRIPTPVPGMTARIDAGFELKYNRPVDDHIVINEVELNPPGADAGREWVELYNPLNHAVDLTDWRFETSHGSQEVQSIEGSVIGPKSHLVHVFPRLMLDNGGETGTPLGESVRLLDADGQVVDTTPYLTDYYNDDNTWQRRSDGAESWVFKTATRGSPNSFQAVVMNDRELLIRSLENAALKAFAKAGEGDLSVDSLASLIEACIAEVVETLIDTLTDSIEEMSLFVELGFQDYSQSMGAGLRLSLSVTGDFVREGLEWMAQATRTVLGSILNPTACIPQAHTLDELLAHIYIRFGGYVEAGLPRILGHGEGRFRCGGQVQVNLATFVSSRSGPREWGVELGVLFEGVQGRYLSTMFAVDADKLVDVWVVWISIHARNANGGSIT